MKYDEIIVSLMRRAIDATAVSSHERVLFRRYSTTQARTIARRLLTNGATTVVGLPEDDGSISEVELPAARWTRNGASIEVLPFVVVDAPEPDPPAWIGSQGFASRLRTSFHLGAESTTTRVLVLFDERPVETEQTTSSERLAAAMDSVPSLLAWFRTTEWQEGYAPDVFPKALEVIEWRWDWSKELLEGDFASQLDLLEQMTDFMESCRPLTSAEEIGEQLPRLGVLFADPELMRARRMESRLKTNSDLAQQLDSIRRLRTLDPIVEADRVLDLGSAGEPFHDKLALALREPNEPVTEIAVTLAEIEDRLRKRDRRPAWLDINGIEVMALDQKGIPEGAALSWRLLRDVPLPPEDDTPHEVVIPCPTDQVRMFVPIAGDLRGFLYRDGSYESAPGDSEGGLVPGQLLALDFPRPDTFEVVEFILRERKPGRGRPARPTQVVRVAIVSDHRIPIPEESTLDTDQDAFAVDGSVDVIRVQVGGREIAVTEDLPPEDGAPIEVEVGGVTFRWRGEDRSPDPEHEVSPRSKVRLLELLGVRATGDPRDIQPYFTDEGSLAGVSRTSALLDVPPAWMELEARLLLSPHLFGGLNADNEAATEELDRVVRDQFRIWLDARSTFFAAIVSQCESRIPGEGGRRPSMYLGDLRDDELANHAKRYIETYTDLLAELAQRASTAASRALLEPVLLCDRAFDTSDALRLAPTHPIAVALLASLQLGLLTSSWDSKDDRRSLERLLSRPLLAGVLPWLPWRGRVLGALQEGPLLWRCYGTEGGTADISDELAPVVVQKVRRLLQLAPHLNEKGQRVYLNVAIGQGSGRYLVSALQTLKGDKDISCTFDVGVACNDNTEAAILRLFSGRPTSGDYDVRGQLQGFVRVCRLQSVHERDAHLAFRMEAAQSTKQPFESMSELHPLVRSTAFAGGLSQEPARFSSATANEVVYTRYVGAGISDEWAAGDAEDACEGIWDGAWRRRFLDVSAQSRHASIGLHSEIRPGSIPCETIRQIAEGDSIAEQYDRSVITVHCDPVQGPEFFVGPRTARSGVYLVECSDRGAPDLPGRDIVAVTSRIGPFRAALATAVETLPQPLSRLVDEEVARGLLRDINVLRGTEVFDFLREVSRTTSHVYFMEGLDNVLALRFLLTSATTIPGALPIVVALRDLTARSEPLAALRKGRQCDDVIVFYVPPCTGAKAVSIRYRLVEVKFGPRRRQWGKAQQQLSATALKLSDRLPTGLWRDNASPTGLLLERDVAWTLHEALERYRAFGLMEDDEELEHAWGLRRLMNLLHRGECEFVPYEVGDSSTGGIPVNGTALMLDPDIPGETVERTIEQATEYLTLPRDVVARLLRTPVERIRMRAGRDSHDASPEPGSAVAPVVSAGASVAEEGAAVDVATDEDAPATEGTGESEAVASLEPETMAIPTESERGGPEGPAVDPAREQLEQEMEQVFDGFIGNSGAVTRLKRALMIAKLEDRRFLEPLGLFGPKSTGKTELARRIAFGLGLRRVELSETILKSADDLAAKIQEEADQSNQPMRMAVDEQGGSIMRAPAMVVFIDEVHLLRMRVQESLLKALEPDDRTLLSTHGTIDTKAITFVIATTDPGALGDAFKSRVSRFDLREYDLDELVRILDAHRQRRDDVPSEAMQFDNACLEMIARVGRLIPRQALRLMRDTAREVSVGLLQPNGETLRAYFESMYHADELGLTDRDRAYLRALFPDHVVGVEALAAQLGEVTANLSSDTEPYLLRLGLIERGRAGRFLTQRGRELVARLRN